MEKFVAATLKNLTAEDIDLMLREMEDTGLCGDYENEEKAIEAYLRDIYLIYEFKGECARDYKTRYDYVCDYGAWEKDYFASWIESCSDYPMLSEIQEFCESVSACIERWIYAVDQGYIDSEEGWAEEEPDLYWVPNHAEHKWYLFHKDVEEAIAEAGVEDGELEGEKSYYWIEIESSCGYGDFDTLEEAKADAEKHADKLVAEAIYRARKDIG